MLFCVVSKPRNVPGWPVPLTPKSCTQHALFPPTSKRENWGVLLPNVSSGLFVFSQPFWQSFSLHQAGLDSLGPASPGVCLQGSEIGTMLASQGQTVRQQDDMEAFHSKPLLLGHSLPITLKGCLMLALLTTCSTGWTCLGLSWSAASAPSSSPRLCACTPGACTPVCMYSWCRHHPLHPPTASCQSGTPNLCPTLVPLTSPNS